MYSHPEPERGQNSERFRRTQPNLSRRRSVQIQLSGAGIDFPGWQRPIQINYRMPTLPLESMAVRRPSKKLRKRFRVPANTVFVFPLHLRRAEGKTVPGCFSPQLRSGAAAIPSRRKEIFRLRSRFFFCALSSLTSWSYSCEIAGSSR